MQHRCEDPFQDTVTTCLRFIDALAGQSPTLRSAYQETVDYWQPDEPPVTTLFAALGVRIAEAFDDVGMDAHRQTFRLIEAAMTSGDDRLVTAVATGLLEGMIGAAGRQEGLWPRIAPMLGERSRRHAEAWLSF
jgi:hypothetical protein